MHNNDVKETGYIYSCNINGLKTKFTEFISNVLINEFRIYMLCETHLDSTINSNEIFPNDFDVFRCDRSNLTEGDQITKKSHGGGVLIATHKSLNGQVIFDGDFYGAEIICVGININYRKYFLVELYIRPNSPIKIFENIVTAIDFLITKSVQKDSIIVSGDFNLSDLLWISDDIDNPNISYPINACSRVELFILDSFHGFGLSQINGTSNNNGKMLDLIWTNDPDLLYCLNSDSFLVKSEVHHKSIKIFKSGCVNNGKNAKYNFYYDFRNANYNDLIDHFNSVDWNLVLSKDSLEDNLRLFYSCVYEAIDLHVVLKKRIISSHPKWFDSKMINLKNRLNELRKKRHYTLDDDLNFRNNRTEYNRYSRIAYNNYKVKMEELIVNDPMEFFKFVNAVRKTNNDFPHEMHYNNQKTSENKDIANLFAKFFASAYTKHNLSLSDICNIGNFESIINFCNNICKVGIDENVILQNVLDLPNNWISGPDRLPNLFIKKCIDTLIKPMTELFEVEYKKKQK